MKFFQKNLFSVSTSKKMLSSPDRPCSVLTFPNFQQINHFLNYFFLILETKKGSNRFKFKNLLQIS